MGACPYCKGDVPAGAVKCLHCGEWLSAPPAAQRDAALSGAVNGLVKLGAVWIVLSVFWAVLVLGVMAAFYFGEFRPKWDRMEREFDSQPAAAGASKAPSFRSGATSGTPGVRQATSLPG